MTVSCPGGLVVISAEGETVAEAGAGQVLALSAGPAGGSHALASRSSRGARRGQTGLVSFHVAGKDGSRESLRIAPVSGGLTLGTVPAPAKSKVRPNTYRGWLTATVVDGKLQIVNELSLEAYLGGVVPSEMPGSFAAEALKAQAVAARSFALCRMNGVADRDWDITDGDGSQVYRGMSAERPSTNQAIAATAGQVLMCGDELCDATYSCDCGGHTASADEMGFGTAKCYLAGTDDGAFCKNAPNHEWRLDWTGDKWRALVKSLGKDVGALKSVAVSQVGPSGRAQMVHFEGDAGSADIRGSAIRKAGGYDVVRSTLFKIEPLKSGTGSRKLGAGNESGLDADTSGTEPESRISDSKSRNPNPVTPHPKPHSPSAGWAVVGKGWGHGVGLCQYGAGGRAKAGQTYKQILSAYFPGTTLKTLSQ